MPVELSHVLTSLTWRQLSVSVFVVKLVWIPSVTCLLEAHFRSKYILKHRCADSKNKKRPYSFFFILARHYQDTGGTITDRSSRCQHIWSHWYIGLLVYTLRWPNNDYPPTILQIVSEFVRTQSDESLSPGVDFGIISRPGYENQTGYIMTSLTSYMTSKVYPI